MLKCSRYSNIINTSSLVDKMFADEIVIQEISEFPYNGKWPIGVGGAQSIPVLTKPWTLLFKFIKMDFKKLFFFQKLQLPFRERY